MLFFYFMDSSEFSTDDKLIHQLVEQAQKGDMEAFSSLYQKLVDRVYRYLYFRLRTEDLEDILEMVFIKVWENIKKYKQDKTPFLSWVFRIAHNLTVDYYRTHRGLQPLPDNIVDERLETNPRHLTEQLLSNELLTRGLSKLKDNYQQVLILRFINDLNVQETAAAMKISLGMVRVLQFRALQSLKNVLLEMGIG